MSKKEHAEAATYAICINIIDDLVKLKKSVMLTEDAIDSNHKAKIKDLLNEINKLLDDLTIKYGEKK